MLVINHLNLNILHEAYIPHHHCIFLICLTQISYSFCSRIHHVQNINIATMSNFYYQFLWKKTTNHNYISSMPRWHNKLIINSISLKRQKAALHSYQYYTSRLMGHRRMEHKCPSSMVIPGLAFHASWIQGTQEK